jgi:hypothetical protein
MENPMISLSQKLGDTQSNHQFNLRFLAKTGTVVFFVLLTSVSASAQQWHISNPPVEHAVPQYRSSYPLHDEPAPNVIPSNDMSAAQPAVQPVVPREPIVEENATSVPPSPTPSPKSKHPSYGLDFSEYRNQEPFPVDPRKRCNVCARPPAVLAQSRHDNWPGYRGLPYQEQEPGGCRCGKKDAPKHDQISAYWPRPLSAVRNDNDHRHLDCATGQPCPQKRLTDWLDSLATFKLIDYKRTDNGYCGPGADRYGCLGESRHR